MQKDNELLEIDESLDLVKIGSIENKFDYLLRENDLLYENKINFNLAYNSINKSYEINIIPANNNFNSQKYFIDNFETETGQEKLEKFRKENNVEMFTY